MAAARALATILRPAGRAAGAPPRPPRRNGARVDRLRVLERGGLPSGVEVRVSVPAAGRVSGCGPGAQAGVDVLGVAAGRRLSAGRPARRRRPRAAVVAAAEAQVGWPYVWGGESRAEGGFDCSGLVDYAYAVAGAPLPGRPTAAALWTLARPAAGGRARARRPRVRRARSGRALPRRHVRRRRGGDRRRRTPAPASASSRWPPAAGTASARCCRRSRRPRATAAAAARRHGVPAHVLESELRLGLAADAEAAARGLAAQLAGMPARSRRRWPTQLGDRSAAALVLRDGSGPGARPVRLGAADGGRAAARSDAARTPEPPPPGVVTRRPPVNQR